MDYSIDFIRKMKDNRAPFFLYHATRGCHFDNYPSDEWAGKSRARTVYSDCMVHMDYVLGQLVPGTGDSCLPDNWARSSSGSGYRLFAHSARDGSRSFYEPKSLSFTTLPGLLVSCL